MSAQHTPGPWVAETEWQSAVFVGGGPNNDDIANLCFADEHTVSISREEANANARLIAAAPELLDALEMVAEADDDVPHIPSMARAKIDAAIAKARGEAA